MDVTPPRLVRNFIKPIPMKRLNLYDSFDTENGIRENLNEMQWNFYEFCYYLTFKKALKEYGKDFFDAEIQEIKDPFFFKDIDDQNVRHISETMLIVSDLRIFFTHLRWEMDLTEDFVNRHRKLRPAHIHKKRKSYSKLLYYYEQQLEGTIRMIYFYASVMSFETFDLPLQMRILPDLDKEGWHWYLNEQNEDVKESILTIVKLNDQLTSFKKLKNKSLLS